MAKTLQSAVETLERDKAQLQGRVHSLEQRLMGTDVSEDAAGAPSSGEEATVRSQNSLRIVINLFFPPCPPAGGAILEQLREEKEFAEGQVRARTIADHASSGVGGLSVLTVSRSSPPDQLPEQRHRGPAAEKRGAEDQTEETRSGRVQRQRRRRRVRRESRILSLSFQTKE